MVRGVFASPLAQAVEVVLFFTLPVLAFLLEYPIGMWRETLQARMLRAGARFGSGGGAVVCC